MKTCRLSFVVNVFNAERFLPATLTSLVAQIPQCHILVVDNHSTDSTAAIARRFTRVKHVLTPEPMPLGAARNFSLSQVETDYVAWVDGDDLWVPGAANLYHEAFERFPQADLFSSGVTSIDEEGNPLPRWKQRWKEKYGVTSPQAARFLPGETVADLLRTTNPRSAWCSYVFKTATIQAVGGVDLELTFSEDFDVIGRVLVRGSAVHIAHNLAMYRVHGSQSTQKIDPRARYDEAYLVASRLGRKLGIPDAEQERLRQILDFKCELSRFRRQRTLGSLGEVSRCLLTPGFLSWLLVEVRSKVQVLRPVSLV